MGSSWWRCSEPYKPYETLSGTLCWKPSVSRTHPQPVGSTVNPIGNPIRNPVVNPITAAAPAWPKTFTMAEDPKLPAVGEKCPDIFGWIYNLDFVALTAIDCRHLPNLAVAARYAVLQNSEAGGTIAKLR